MLACRTRLALPGQQQRHRQAWVRLSKLGAPPHPHHTPPVPAPTHLRFRRSMEGRHSSPSSASTARTALGVRSRPHPMPELRRCRASWPSWSGCPSCVENLPAQGPGAKLTLRRANSSRWRCACRVLCSCSGSGGAAGLAAPSCRCACCRAAGAGPSAAAAPAVAGAGGQSASRWRWRVLRSCRRGASSKSGCCCCRSWRISTAPDGACCFAAGAATACLALPLAGSMRSVAGCCCSACCCRRCAEVRGDSGSAGKAVLVQAATAPSC